MHVGKSGDSSQGPGRGSPPSGARARPTILIVDDEPDLRDALHDLIAAATQADVVTAESATKALEVARSRSIDLVVSDYRMPGMDGLEFLAQMARQSPEVPRVMMTAYPDQELAIRAINEASIETFLTKPLDPGEVVRVCRDLLGQRLAATQRQQAFTRAISPAAPATRPEGAPSVPFGVRGDEVLAQALSDAKVDAAALVGRDGLAVSSKSRGPVDLDTVAAMAAAAFAALDSAAASLGAGPVTRTVVEIAERRCVITATGTEHLLLVLGRDLADAATLGRASDAMAESLQLALAER